MIKKFENFIQSKDEEINEAYSDSQRKNVIELKKYLDAIQNDDKFIKRSLLILGDYEQSINILDGLDINSNVLDGENMTEDEFFHQLCLGNNQVMIIKGIDFASAPIISMFKSATDDTNDNIVILSPDKREERIRFKGHIIVLAEDEQEEDWFEVIKARSKVIDLR